MADNFDTAKTLINMKAVYIAMIHMARYALFIIFCILFAFSSATSAQEEVETDQETLDAIDEEIRWLQSETYVITPSKIPEKIKKTAASVTVVTDRQIRQIGAKHLKDVIDRIVPSFWTKNSSGLIFLQTRATSSSRILIMINGFPVHNESEQADVWNNYSFLSMDNVKRIEFIRGPGSALYGANAYHGVINIITKKAEDVDGVELTARGGSWDTQQYNLLFGKEFSDLEVTFNFNYFKTHGHSAFIKEDLQTLIDQYEYAALGYPPISLTPGYTKEHDEKYELAINVKYKGFTFDGGYIDRQYEEPWLKTQAILTEKSTLLPEKYYMNLSYETSLGEKLDLSAKAYRFFEQYHWAFQESMPGTVDIWASGSFGTVWPDGWYVEVKNKESRMGMEIQSTYKISDCNTIVAGATYEELKSWDNEEWADIEYLEDSDALVPLPSMQRIVESSYPDRRNDFKALFLEDVWDINEDLRLTLGARYDDYSSFGSHFSPRAGLTWEYIKGYDLKLLYGHAYSIPSFAAIAFQLPGTTLKPQTIDTYEISLGAEFTSSFEMRVTLFQNNDNDLITLLLRSESIPRNGYANYGESRSQGIEVEARYDFGRGTYIAGNYSYTSVDGSNSEKIYLGKIMSNIRLSRYLNLNVDCLFQGGLNTKYMDLSGSSENRTIVNATLIARKFLKGFEGLELRGTVYNLFDEDWAEFASTFIPYGWPQPGRNFLLEVRYKF